MGLSAFACVGGFVFTSRTVTRNTRKLFVFAERNKPTRASRAQQPRRRRAPSHGRPHALRRTPQTPAPSPSRGSQLPGLGSLGGRARAVRSYRGWALVPLPCPRAWLLLPMRDPQVQCLPCPRESCVPLTRARGCCCPCATRSGHLSRPTLPSLSVVCWSLRGLLFACWELCVWRVGVWNPP